MITTHPSALDCTHKGQVMALVECWECGKQVSDRAPSCIGCGAPLAHSLKSDEASQTATSHLQSPGQAQASGSTKTPPQIVIPAKSRGVYIILGLFLFGMFGAHNFYAGRYAAGVGQLLCTAILGWFVIGLVITFLWVLVDLITVTHDGNGVEMA